MYLHGLFSAATVLCTLAGYTGVANSLAWRGADISSVPVVEAAGISYKDTNGAAGKFENIMKAHGANAARVRIWTAGTYNTAFALSLAKVRDLEAR